ncbi:MAG TPA: methylated-DNA--[protein]-cysteine S-methyltransferase [Dehalococcoidia bacterium]|nr:methylated-DNA--[protein]-cysteine S-methyltransferase [Dehalococcoidia bacterium]
MPAFTCEQTLAVVTEARPRDMTRETAVAVADHLLACDDCRTGIVSCHIAQSLMEQHTRALAPQTAVDLAGHLVKCDACRSRAEAMREVQSFLESIDIPRGLAERLTATTREHLARQLRARTFETPFGWSALAYADSGLVLIERSQSPADAREGLRARLGDFVVQERPRDDIGESAVRKLLAYYHGERVRFDEPIDLSLVPPFTQRVLQTTARIPYGQVRPYAWVAREIGKPRATRAVGQSLHINPVAPIIPCHRVIASDNTLGGYGGGPEMKEWLLKLEGYLN